MRMIEDVINPAGKLSPGVYQIESDANYRDVNRMNPSSLAAGLMSNFEVDPTLIRLAYERGDTKRTAAQQDRMDRGTLAHLFILQPELVTARVAVHDFDRRAGKEWNDFCLANDGKLLIHEQDFNEVKQAAEQALSVPRVRQMFAGTEAEMTILGQEDSGIYTKGRVDAVKRGEMSLIVDLKTTEAGIDSQSVKRTIRDFHYREKMAMYRRMFCQATDTDPEMVQCYNVFIKLPPPVSIRVVKFSSISLEFGELRMMRAMDAVKRCIDSSEWPVFVGDDIAEVDPWEEPGEKEIAIEY